MGRARLITAVVALGLLVGASAAYLASRAESLPVAPLVLWGKSVDPSRIIFAVDSSESMLFKDMPISLSRAASIRPSDARYAAYSNDWTRLSRVRGALSEAILRLDEKSFFVVVSFNSEIRSSHAQLVPATAQRKAEAIAFLNAIQPSGFTRLDLALRAILDSHASTAILVNDGLPQSGKDSWGVPVLIDRAELLNWISDRSDQCRIFTFGLGTSDSKFLELLAVRTGGAYAPIPPLE